MSAMRKMGVYLGLLEDADGDYAEPHNEYDEPARRSEPRAEHEPARPVANLSERRRPAREVPRATTTVAPMSRITTLHPRTYNEARVIGENFRDGVPVIMNLSEMDDTDAKRLVDFAAGPGVLGPGHHRARHQQGVPALPAQRLGDCRGQAAHRRGRVLQPELTGSRNPLGSVP